MSASKPSHLFETSVTRHVSALNTVRLETRLRTLFFVVQKHDYSDSIDAVVAVFFLFKLITNLIVCILMDNREIELRFKI